MYIKIYKFVIVVIIMANNELEALKNEIEAVREESEVGRYRLVHITVTGLHHPLREPYVPLSEYTALLLFVRKNSLSTFTCVYESRDDDNESIQQEFYVVSLSLPFPNALYW